MINTNITPQAEALRGHFNIEKIRTVKLTRVMNTPQPLYLVIVDSKRPNFPLSTASVLSALPRNFLYTNGRSTPLTPFIDLDKYKGNIKTAMYMLIDLAGSLRYKNMYTEATSSKLQEVTLLDLKSADTMSKLTKVFFDERNKLVGQGNRAVKLIDVRLTPEGVCWDFLTESTQGQMLDDTLVQRTNADNNFELEHNASKLYDMTIRIPDFFEYLSTKPVDAGELTKADLHEVFKVVDAQLHCTCPAFNWQGLGYNLHQLEATVYPFTIAPTSGAKGWKDRQSGTAANTGLVCKHLGQLLKYISFFEQPMINMLNKRIKDNQ